MSFYGYNADDLNGLLKCLVDTEEKKYNLDVLDDNPPCWPNTNREIFAPRIHRLLVLHSSEFFWELGKVS